MIPCFASSSAPSIAFCTPKECATIVTSVPRKYKKNGTVRNTELVYGNKVSKTLKFEKSNFAAASIHYKT